MWDDVFKSLNGRLIVIGKAKVVMQNSAKIDVFGVFVSACAIFEYSQNILIVLFCYKSYILEEWRPGKFLLKQIKLLSFFYMKAILKLFIMHLHSFTLCAFSR